MEEILEAVANYKIKFAEVNKDFTRYEHVDGIHVFPDETELRKFRLENKYVIWLDEVADRNCKNCYGKGKTVITRQFLMSDTDFAIKVKNYLLKEPATMPDKIIELMGLDQNSKEALTHLTSMANKELTLDDDYANFEVAKKYSRMIKKDFPIESVLFCQCFLRNLRNKVAEMIREKKFSIN